MTAVDGSALVRESAADKVVESGAAIKVLEGVGGAVARTVYSHALPALQEEVPYAGADSQAYSLGQDFTVLANTVIYGVRVWNPGQRAVARNLRIYNNTTQVPWQTLTTPNTLTPGWNEFLLATPVTFLTGTTYTVSMNAQGASGPADEHFNDYGAKSNYLTSNVDTGNIRMNVIGGCFVNAFDASTRAGGPGSGTFNASYYGFDLLYAPTSATGHEAVKVQQATNRAAATTSLAVTFGAAATVKNHIFVAVDCAATVNTPAGFTLIESHVSTSGLYLFCKQSVGGETTVNVVPTSNATVLAFMWEVSGLVDAVAATIKDGSATNVITGQQMGVYGNVSGATPSQADTYQVGLLGGQVGAAAAAVDPGVTMGQLYDFQQLFDGAQSATPGNMLQVAYRHNHTTGAKGFTAAHGVISGVNNSILTANFKVA